MLLKKKNQTLEYSSKYTFQHSYYYLHMNTTETETDFFSFKLGFKSLNSYTLTDTSIKGTPKMEVNLGVIIKVIPEFRNQPTITYRVPQCRS